MNAINEKWPLLWKTAKQLGIKEKTIYQWRHRDSVPGKWHLRLIAESRGKLKAADFSELVE